MNKAIYLIFVLLFAGCSDSENAIVNKLEVVLETGNIESIVINICGESYYLKKPDKTSYIDHADCYESTYNFHIRYSDGEELVSDVGYLPGGYKMKSRFTIIDKTIVFNGAVRI